MDYPIQVQHNIATTAFSAIRRIKIIDDMAMKEGKHVSFDIETAGIYSKQQRKEAQQYLDNESVDSYTRRLYSTIANNNGLSFPSVIQTTHFIFGTNYDSAFILIPTDPFMEMVIWNQIAQMQCQLIIHNALFDLKVMYNRTGKLPQNFEDSAIRAKCLINNADSWKAKTGLKVLMGEYYNPSWALFDEYETNSPKNDEFLLYAATDGAATYYLWDLLNDQTRKNDDG